MAGIAAGALRDALAELTSHDEERAARILTAEANADHYEDVLGTYLVKLSAMPLSEQDTVESSELLHMIGDLERISDHAVNLLESGEELRAKKIVFTDAAQAELKQLTAAVDEVVELAMRAFTNNDLTAAALVEPLEQVVDELKEKLRSHHILRLQRGECSIEAGFVWSDLLTDLERVADHCSNIAGCVLEMRYERLDLHGYLDTVRTGNADYATNYETYARKYAVE
jgi:phosphate:Na+ symporter